MNNNLLFSASLQASSAVKSFSFDKAGLSLTDITLIISALVPVITALIVFLLCIHAMLKRKFISYFASMLSYIALTLFVFSDIRGFFALLGKNIGGLSDGFLALTGLIAASALGVVLMGLDALVCSSGITKAPGRIIMTVSTVLFTAVNMVLLFSLMFSDSIGSHSSVDIEIVKKENETVILSFGFDFLSASVLALHSVITVFSFLFNKNHKELREENQKLFESLATEAAADDNTPAEKKLASGAADEKCCAVCQYALPLTGIEGKVLCERKGVTSAGYRCGRFVYDPLKRPVAAADNTQKDKENKVDE
ncbi:MAG: hypothetical protein MJ137_08295 [Clostridia bacterium]|nr:hypothetical protein [Clostridia bacterium]